MDDNHGLQSSILGTCQNLQPSKLGDTGVQNHFKFNQLFLYDIQLMQKLYF